MAGAQQHAGGEQQEQQGRAQPVAGLHARILGVHPFKHTTPAAWPGSSRPGIRMMRAAVTPRVAVLVGVTGASAVLLGAFGAHALRGVLDARGSELWHTAVDYHVWHALALAVAAGLGRGRSGRVAATAFAVG